jgi:hypothetical protein
MVLSRSVTVDSWYGATPWFGATQLDGIRGVELVTGQFVGPHSQWFTVLAYRAGRLLVLPPPGGDASPNGGRWYVDISIVNNAGVTCGTMGTITVHTADITGKFRSYDLSEATYRWSTNTWHVKRAKRSRIPAAEKAKLPGTWFGWHCAGLPVF